MRFANVHKKVCLRVNRPLWTRMATIWDRGDWGCEANAMPCIFTLLAHHHPRVKIIQFASFAFWIRLGFDRIFDCSASFSRHAFFAPRFQLLHLGLKDFACLYVRLLLCTA